jgi:hypothetical protein
MSTRVNNELLGVLAELLAGQRALLDGQRRIEAGLLDLRRESAESRLARILPAWAGAIGSSWSSVADAFDQAAIRALEMSPSQLGSALYAGARRRITIDGLRVEQHAKKIGHASCFRIVRVSGA